MSFSNSAGYQKLPSIDRDVGGDNNKVYVKIIDNFYVIVTARRNLDGFKW